MPGPVFLCPDIFSHSDNGSHRLPRWQTADWDEHALCNVLRTNGGFLGLDILLSYEHPAMAAAPLCLLAAFEMLPATNRAALESVGPKRGRRRLSPCGPPSPRPSCRLGGGPSGRPPVPGVHCRYRSVRSSRWTPSARRSWRRRRYPDSRGWPFPCRKRADGRRCGSSWSCR